jgi:hypothetical protein
MDEPRTLGWTVRAKGAPTRFLRIGWMMGEGRIGVEPEWKWILADDATFQVGMTGAVVLYEFEANAQKAAAMVGGDVVKVWTVPHG